MSCIISGQFDRFSLYVDSVFGHYFLHNCEFDDHFCLIISILTPIQLSVTKCSLPVVWVFFVKNKEMPKTECT